MKNIILAFVLAFAAMALQGANSVQMEGLDTTGGKTLEIASGNTLEITGKITGSGLLTTSGTGTLVLSNPENDWTGGLKVGPGGHLTITAQGALGSGKLIVGSGDPGYVTFAAGVAVFDNDIDYGRSGSEIIFATDTTLRGTVKIGNNDCKMYAKAGVTGIIEGKLMGADSNKSRPLVLDDNKGVIIFKGAIDTLSAPPISITEWNGRSDGGVAYFCASGNRIKELRIGTMSYVCSNKNVLTEDTSISVNKNASASGTFDLNGYDQTIKGFALDSGVSALNSGSVSANIRSAEPATLTLKGNGAGTSMTCNFAINGKVSLCIDSDIAATNKFLNRIHATEGDIAVKSGCMWLSGANAAFAAVKSLSIAAGGAFFCDSTASKPLPDGIALTLETGSELRLPEGVVVSVSSLIVDGVKKQLGVYSSADIPALVFGAIKVLPDSEKSLIWTGGGQSENVSDLGNWSSEDVDFASQTVAAEFASSGNRAVIDRDVYFSALSLTSDDFTFASGGGTMAVLADSIGFAAKEGNPARKFAFEASMKLDRDLSVVLPANTEFCLSGDISALGTKTISLNASAAGASAVLNGIDLDGNLSVRTFAVEGVNTANSFTLAPDSVNRIKGKFTVKDYSNQMMYLKPGSELTVEGGINLENGCQISGGGRLVVVGLPFTCNLKKECHIQGSLALEGTPHFIFNAENNTVNLFCNGYGGLIDCRVSGAFAGKTHLKMDARWNGNSVLKLNSTTQDWTYVKIQKTSSGPVSVIGGAGARIRVSGDKDSEILATNATIAVVGEVSIEKTGTGTMMISNCTFDTSAEYDVSGGTLVLAQGMLHPESVLRLSGDGIISVADGMSQRFSAVFVDGVQIGPGVYSYATAPEGLKAHMAETTGRIRIPGGMILIVR